MIKWFNNRTVSARFFLISAVLIPLLLMLGGSGIWGAFQLHSNLQGTNSDELYSVYTLSLASESISELVNFTFAQTLNLATSIPQGNTTTSGDTAAPAENFQTTLNKNLSQLQQAWQAYKATSIDNEEAEVILQFDNTYKTWQSDLNSITQFLIHPNTSSTLPTTANPTLRTSQLTSDQYNLLNQIYSKANDLKSNVEELKTKSYQDSLTKAQTSANLFSLVVWVISLSLIGVVIIFVIAGLLLRYSLLSLTNSLLDSNQKVKQAFAESENKRQVGETVSNQLKEMTSELSRVALQQSSHAQQESSAVQEITVNLGELALTSRQIAGNAASVRETAVASLQSAQEVQVSTAQTNQSAMKVQATVNATLKAIEQVREAMDALNQKLQNLKEDSQRMNVVLSLIKEIADQTHLLSLNASIESAGAGMYGERFGVVAFEVKELAQRALAAAKEVSHLLGGVQTGVNDAALSSATASTKTQEAAAQSQDTAAVITQLTQVVQITSERAIRIVAATEQVVSQTEEISLATLQQDGAVRQVTTTMETIDLVLQESALGATELSSTSHAIDILAEQLHHGLA